MFISRKAFTEPFTESYAYTLETLNKAKTKRAQEVEAGKEWSSKQELRQALQDDHDWSLLSDMMRDMRNASATASNYYEKGVGWHKDYCHLSFMPGGHSYGCESLVERLVVNRLCNVGGQEQRETDEEFEARAERVLRGYDTSGICHGVVVRVGTEETERNSGDA